jgi:hypothetical protein
VLVLPVLALLLPAPARAAEAFGDAVYYFGDIHAHTGYSADGGASDLTGCTSCGAFADFFAAARANGLDFVGMADHTNELDTLSSTNWRAQLTATLAADDPAGGFVTIPGGEIWYYDGTHALGHKTLMLFGDDATLAPITLTETRYGGNIRHRTGCATIWTWADAFVALYGDLLLVPHHPAATRPMPTDWDCHSDTYEPVVEIYSRHGNSLEDTSGYDPIGAGTTTTGLVTSALDPDGQALQMGFVGGTDEHDTRPGATCAADTVHTAHLYGGGLTAIVLDAGATFDRAAIHDALVAHHTYTTTGPRMALSIGWSSVGGDLGGLGDDFSMTEGDDLEVAVSLPADEAAYVSNIELVGPDGTWSLDSDGADTWTTIVSAGDIPAYLYARVEIDGDAWYGSTTCADGGADATEYLWSSPSWIAQVDDDLDDDGVNARDGDCDDTDPTVSPALADTWYDGIDTDCDGASDFDQDADGSELGVDCDDTDAWTGPGADEIWYDGVDEDCDGLSDFDQDGDGFELDTEGGEDCDDTDAAVNPDAAEAWYDGADADCDGLSDFDQDGDGFEALTEGGEDCDDADAAVNPLATELWYDGVDQDCDRLSDYDRDGDGFEAASTGGDDCDDTDLDIAPDMRDDTFDGVDDDCDGTDGPPVAPVAPEAVGPAATDTGSAPDDGAAAADTGAAPEPPAATDTGDPVDTGTAAAAAESGDTGSSATSAPSETTTEASSATSGDTGGAEPTTSAPAPTAVPTLPPRHRHRPALAPDGGLPLQPDGKLPRRHPRH